MTADTALLLDKPAMSATGPARPATPNDVLQCYRLFLGRSPESTMVVDEVVGLKLTDLLGRILQSEEFALQVGAPLRDGTRIAGELFYKRPADDLKAWAGTLPLSPEHASLVQGATSWRELHAAVLSDETFRQNLPEVEELLAPFAKLEVIAPSLSNADDVLHAYTIFLGRLPEAGVLEDRVGSERLLLLEGLVCSEEFILSVANPMRARTPLMAPAFATPPSRHVLEWASTLPLTPKGVVKAALAVSWHELHNTIFSDESFQAAIPVATALLTELSAIEAPKRDEICTRDDAINMYRLILGRDPESEVPISEIVGLDLIECLTSKIASDEFDHRVRRPMLARQAVSGIMFDQPPSQQLKDWAAKLPLMSAAREAVLQAPTWFGLHQLIFADPVFTTATQAASSQTEGLGDALPPEAKRPSVRKEIPDNILIRFPLTDRFFQSRCWWDADHPDVSIIILSYCRPDLVENLIRSIWLNSTGFTYEVIVVDNGSPPGMHTMSRAVEERVKVLRLERNQYLGDAYNIGVENARGRYLVLMNNDIVVETDWLKPLVQPMEEDAQIGAVGPKFLYPTGQLQEAGALIDASGYSVQLGKRGAADAPEFNTIREVHYCTGATLATRRDVYLDVGGYDWRWSPGYYEDVDFCFKLHDRGLKTIYTPDSSVFHIESATMQERPPSLHLGIAIENNRRRLVAKWSGLLAGEPAARSTDPDGWNLRRFHDVKSGHAQKERRVGVFFPYEIIPGGGEKFALSILEQLASDANLFLVFESQESVLRILSVVADLGFPDLPFATCTLADAIAGEPFDIFFVIGNELFPVRPALGKINYFICQFPFPTSHEFLSEYHNRGYYKDYSGYLVYSKYVHTQVSDLLHNWLVRTKVHVLSPTVDMIGVGEEKLNDIVSVGRFFTGGHNKRHDSMIEAMGHLSSVAPELGCALHLGGALHNGAEHREHLQKLRLQAEGLPITFHLDISRGDLNRRYQAAKVYWHAAGWGVDTQVHPEAVEHFGITILEAMSAGCVPVVYAAGGPAEIVKHGVNGFLVLGAHEMTDWTIKIIQGWETPLIRAVRARALETAAQFNKSAFRHRMTQIGIVPETAA